MNLPGQQENKNSINKKDSITLQPDAPIAEKRKSKWVAEVMTDREVQDNHLKLPAADVAQKTLYLSSLKKEGKFFAAIVLHRQEEIGKFIKRPIMALAKT